MMPLRRSSPPPVIRGEAAARVLVLVGAALFMAGLFLLVQVVDSGKIPGTISEALRLLKP